MPDDRYYESRKINCLQILIKKELLYYKATKGNNETRV